MKPFQVAAFALPVSNGIADKFERRDAAKIRYRKDGIENSLQPGIFSFFGQHVHLEEALVGILLHFDQIRNLYGCLYFGKIGSFTESNGFNFRHF